MRSVDFCGFVNEWSLTCGLVVLPVRHLLERPSSRSIYLHKFGLDGGIQRRYIWDKCV